MGDHYHPIGLLSKIIQKHFEVLYMKNGRSPLFTSVDSLHPVVTTSQQFDTLLMAEDHVARSKSDNYYVNSGQCLRGHTSAHQVELLKSGLDCFLVFGDVYRRDEIDATHYPAFHQLEGVRLFTQGELRDLYGLDEQVVLRHKEQDRNDLTQAEYDQMATDLISQDLKGTLIRLIHQLLGPDIEYRWIDEYFPFTHPSFELEILWKDEWIEILGCGVMEHKILKQCGANSMFGWAFGIGLERLAMLMFEIPDIRMLWTDNAGYKKSMTAIISNMYDEYGGPDSPHLSASAVRELRMPTSFLKNSPVTQHISFFMEKGKSVAANDVYDTVREVAGELIESVRIQDKFFHPGKQMDSNMFELIYRCPAGRAMTNEECTVFTNKIGEELVSRYGVVPRWESDSSPKVADEAEKLKRADEKARKRKEKDKAKFEAKQ